VVGAEGGGGCTVVALVYAVGIGGIMEKYCGI